MMCYVSLRASDFPVPAPPPGLCPQLKSEAMSRFGDAASSEVLWVSLQNWLLEMESSQLQGWPHVPSVQEGSVLCPLLRLVHADVWLLFFCCGPVSGSYHFS